jgi:hypothetical protein
MEAKASNIADEANSKLDFAVLAIPALIKVTLHLLTYKGFGFFSDEFYYIACSKRLAWGYVAADSPSLIAFELPFRRSKSYPQAYRILT